MKIKSLMPLLLLFLVWTGCEGQRPGQKSNATLSVSPKSVCLQRGSQENCKGGTKRVLHLTAQGGRIRMDEFEMELANRPGNWVSFSEKSRLREGKYQIRMEGKRMILEGEAGKFQSTRSAGFLVQLYPKGARVFMPDQKGPPMHKIEAGKGQLLMDGTSYGSTMLMTSVPLNPKSNKSALAAIVMGDEASRIRVNDTGTEIILDDVFRAVSCCEYAKKLRCCDGLGGTGKGGLMIPAKPQPQRPVAMEAVEMMGKYFPEPKMAAAIVTGSWKTIMTIVAADACLFRSGNNLIIIDCSTGDVYCLDSSECIILLESNEAGEIAVMVKENCDVFDELEPCQ